MRCTLYALLFAAACSGDGTTGPRIFSLRFSMQPGATVAGQPVTAAVELLDGDGNRATSARDRVTLSVFSAATANPVSVNASGGVAAFDDLVVTKASPAQMLQATVGGLTAVSLPFIVSAASANGDQSEVELAATTFPSNTPQSLTFTFRDTYGNIVPKASVSLSSSLAGSTFAPGSGTSGADGRFMANYRSPPGNATLSATVNGNSVTLGQALTIADACTPVPISMPGAATGTFVRGDGCLVDGNPTAIRQFNIAAAGGAAFTVTAPFGAAFEIRSNPATAGIAFFTDSTVTIEWLLLPGAFQFRIGAPFVGGTYQLSSALVPANTGQRIRTLLTPGTYTGQSLATTDFYDGSSYSDFFFFADSRPCTITLRSTAFDAMLLIVNAITGDLVGVDRNAGGGTDAQIVRPSCLSLGQPIAIGVTSEFPDEVGPYTLTVATQGGGSATASVQRTATRPISAADIRDLMRRVSATRRR